MSDARTEVRRRDRAKDDAWISEYLTRAPYGHLSMSLDGQPFVNSNLFVYDADRNALFLHTARTGRTADLLAHARPVAFTTTAMGRLLPAAEALEFSVEYSGVTVFGRGRTVPEPQEQARVLQLLLDKYAPHLRPGRDYRAITDAELKRTAVYRVDIESWSGKEKAESEDFPGAFPLPGLPIPFRAPEAGGVTPS